MHAQASCLKYGCCAAGHVWVEKRRKLMEQLLQGKTVHFGESTRQDNLENVLSEADQKSEAIEINVENEGETSSVQQKQNGENLEPSTWYETNQARYEAEMEAMRQFYPDFRAEKLDDGRICWIGTLHPSNTGKIVWTIMAVWEPLHPHGDTSEGDSVKVYAIQPDLNTISRQLNRLPYVLRDKNGSLYMSVLPMGHLSHMVESPSVAVYISYAAHWILFFEQWLDGIAVFSEDAFSGCE